MLNLQEVAADHEKRIAAVEKELAALREALTPKEPDAVRIESTGAVGEQPGGPQSAG